MLLWKIGFDAAEIDPSKIQAVKVKLKDNGVLPYLLFTGQPSYLSGSKEVQLRLVQVRKGNLRKDTLEYKKTAHHFLPSFDGIMFIQNAHEIVEENQKKQDAYPIRSLPTCAQR